MGDASAELRKFLKKFKLPVVTTLMGISSVDTTEELSMHMLGMHGTAYANYAVEDCDFLIAIGARFDDRVAGKVGEFAPNARNIAHIDLDSAEIGKVKAVTWSHNANAKRSLTELLKFGKDVKTSFPDWHKHLKSIKKKHCLNYNRKSPLIQPAEVLIEMNNITKGNAIISTGVGQHQMFAAQYIDYKKPRTWLTSGSMGTMGFGLPAAIGAQLACPDAIVIDVDGDGSIRMNIGELETMTTYGVNVKVLLLNNTCDGMVRQWQNMMYEERYSGTDKALHKKDFIMAAKADGFDFAMRVSERKQLKKSMKAFIDFKGPAFLEVMTDIDSMIFPMVGPGKGYKEMQTGPFIVAREPEEAVEVTDTGDTAMF